MQKRAVRKCDVLNGESLHKIIDACTDPGGSCAGILYAVDDGAKAPLCKGTCQPIG